MGRKYDTYAYRKEHYPNWFKQCYKSSIKWQSNNPNWSNTVLAGLKMRALRKLLASPAYQNDPGFSIYKAALQERLDNL